MTEGAGDGHGFTLRRAKSDELGAVLGILDGAALETDATAIREAFEREAVVVAESDRGTILGALVLDDDEITHVAVRPGRRGQGIGTALVAAAAEERDSLTARFDAAVRPFYESLGFAIEPADAADRYCGRLDEGLDDVTAGDE